MSLIEESVVTLALHSLLKEGHGPASIRLRRDTLRPTAAATRLVQDLQGHYGTRPGKVYGRFEEDEIAFPVPALLRRYLDGELDFDALTVQMMEHLKLRAEGEPLATGGHVLIARISSSLADELFVAILSETLGTAIDADLNIVDSPHIDLGSLRAAGRIDLAAWRAGAERYISFLNGRNEVASYFKRFLGCNDVVIALKETQKLVKTLSHFADAQGLQQDARDGLMQRAHTYLDDLGESAAPLDFDSISRQVWPDEPERLQQLLNDASQQLASGFVPDRRAIRPLMRFRAHAPQWKLEFDRAGLRSGAVIYDREADTVILSGVPEHLKRALLEE